MAVPLRSLLFCPASRPDRLGKALGSGADAVIVDLEDGVALSEKDKARGQISALLTSKPTGRTYIRINGVNTTWSFPDLLASVRPGLDGIVLPKTEEPHEVKEASWVIGGLERERGLEAGRLEIIPLIESAAGVLHAEAIARADRRVSRLAFGFLDFVLDINTAYSQEGGELFYARSQLVLASRAAGLLPPLDGVYPDLSDPAGLEAETRRVRQLGFLGKLLIHPAQVEVVNRLFTPGREEIAEARRIDRAFREAEEQGIGAVQVEGRLVDYPVARRARQLLALAENLGLEG